MLLSLELQVTYERGKGNLHTMSSLANGRVVKFRIILTAGMVQEIQPRNNSGRTSGFRPGQYRSSRGLHREVVCIINCVRRTVLFVKMKRSRSSYFRDEKPSFASRMVGRYTLLW